MNGNTGYYMAILSKSYEVTEYACITRDKVRAAGTGSHFARSEVNELCVNELGAEENDISRV